MTKRRAFAIAGVVCLLAALDAVAWPLSRQHERSVAAAAEIERDLRALVAAEDSFHIRNHRFAQLAELGLNADSIARRRVVLTRDGWYTLASETHPAISCSVWVGSTGIDPADEERVPACETQYDWTFLWYGGVLLLLSATFGLLARRR